MLHIQTLTLSHNGRDPGKPHITNALVQCLWRHRLVFADTMAVCLLGQTLSTHLFK
jgi:hypothetical protein